MQNRKLRSASRAVNFTDTAGKYEQGTWTIFWLHKRSLYDNNNFRCDMKRGYVGTRALAAPLLVIPHMEDFVQNVELII